MKIKTTILSVLLGAITSQAQPLLVDFNNQTSPTNTGYRAYRATTTQPATFTSQFYSAFGTTVSITPVWDTPTATASIRMLDRGTANTGNAGTMAALFQDWIGTDNRTTAIPSGSNPMTLSISNLPAGTYRWLSYHHDPNDQTGVFNAYVTDAKGTKGPTAVDISNGNLAPSSVTTWITLVTSDGVNPVRFRFTGPTTVTVTAQSFFVMNGFELTFLGAASEWTNTTGGNWSASANWDSGVPNSTTSLALLGNRILAPSTVTVDTPVTLSGLTMSSAQGYTLAGANGITLGDSASISLDIGSHTIAVPLGVTGGGGLTLAGAAGSLTLSGANTYTGPTVANISALSIASIANGGSPSAVGASASDAANLVFGGTLRYVGSGHTSDRLFTLGAGTRTLDASGTGPLNLSNAGELALSGTGARTLVLAGTNTDNNTLSAVVKDAGASPAITTLVKNGPGKWVLAGANTSSGNVTVNEGTLALAASGTLGYPLVITVQSNAVLDASAAGGLALTYGPALQGSGTVLGNVSDGSGVTVIRPGGGGVAGTLTLANGLTMNSGGILEMDLTSSTTVGSGVNDLIEVGGDLDLSSATLKVNFTGASLGSSYRLINYAGNLFGTPSVTVQGLEETRYTAVVTASGGQVNLVVSGAPAALVWLGDGSANLWDVKTSATWTNQAANNTDVFNHLDPVVFNDLGSTATNVNVDAIVKPGAVTVNSAADYYLGGTGRLSGGMSLLKSGAGRLTISNANNFSGGTTISAGILRLGSDTALGSSAGTTVIQSGATLDVNSYLTSTNHIFVTGSGVGGMGAIINTSADEQNAVRKLTLTGDTLVSSDFRWDVRGTGGNGTFTGIFDLAGFTFSKTGTNRFAIVDCNATNAGNIIVIQGPISLTRSRVEGDGYINMGTNLLFIENSATGMVTKPLIFNNGTLQCGGNDFVMHAFITNVSGLTLDTSTILTISNLISGNGALTKNGASVARLEAANTYAGNTTISAGTLTLGTNATLGSGSVIELRSGATFDVTSQNGFTVPAGKTLIGGGTVNGGLVVANGATLEVGTTTNTETLSVVNGNAVLGGTTVMQVNATTVATDTISTTNTITFGGALLVSNLGGSFKDGDTFKLFNAPVLGGSFSGGVVLPALGAGQIWMNNLSVDGTIAVADVTFTTTILPGGFWQFTWPIKLNGMVKMQAQTNALDVGLSTNWSDYPNGDFNGVLHIPDSSNPSVFFRMSTQ